MSARANTLEPAIFFTVSCRISKMSLNNGRISPIFHTFQPPVDKQDQAVEKQSGHNSKNDLWDHQFS